MITRFKDEYRWLSNFSPVEVYVDGLKYKSVEHGYVASKTLSVGFRHEVQAIGTPGEAKRFGKLLPLRPDWDLVKLSVMENLVRQKFRTPEYEGKLLETGTQEIIEGNVWHDNYWGSCICESCGNKGQNTLGKLIMKVREELKQPLLTFE